MATRPGRPADVPEGVFLQGHVQGSPMVDDPIEIGDEVSYGRGPAGARPKIVT